MTIHSLDMPVWFEGNCRKCKHHLWDYHKCWCYDSDTDNVLRISCNADECKCEFIIKDDSIDWG